MYWTLIHCGPGRLKMVRASCTYRLETLLPSSQHHGQRARRRPNAVTRSITCSMVRPVESITSASGAGFSGDTARGRIPLVPLGDLARKGGKANIRPLVFQLLIAAQSPLTRGGGQKYFEVGLRKYNGYPYPGHRLPGLEPWKRHAGGPARHCGRQAKRPRGKPPARPPLTLSDE